MYAYGVLVALTIVLGELLNKHAVYAKPVVYAASAGTMLVIGTALLVRFLRDYPLSEEDPTSGEAANVGR